MKGSLDITYSIKSTAVKIMVFSEKLRLIVAEATNIDDDLVVMYALL